MRGWRCGGRGVVVATVGVSIVVGLLSVGCRQAETRVCPASLEGVGHEDFVAVQAAAIWWWLDRVEEPRGLGWLFVSADGADIDDELRAALRHRYWMRPRYWRVRSLLLPASIAEDGANGFAHDVTTGERGTRFWVAGTRFSSPTSANTNVGVRGGGEMEVFLLCDESGWRVYDVGGGIAY